MDIFERLKRFVRTAIRLESRILMRLKEGDKYDVGKIWDESILADLKKLDKLLVVLLRILNKEGNLYDNLSNDEILRHLHKLVSERDSLLRRSQAAQIKEIDRVGVQEWFQEYSEEIRHLNELLYKIVGHSVEVSLANGQKMSLILRKVLDPAYFAHLQIMTREDEKPMKERMPSNSRATKSLWIGNIPSNELVWLTVGEVENRIAVLLLTHPLFNEMPSAVVQQTKQTHVGDMISESNIRVGIPIQNLINNFEESGFYFVRVPSGKLSVLIDATVPASENTNGRYQNIELSAEVWGATGIKSFVMPGDKKKVGFRPVTSISTHGIAIPVDKLIELHLKNAPIKSYYMGQDQSAESAGHLLGHTLPSHYLTKVSEVKQYVAKCIIYHFLHFRNNPKYSKLVEALETKTMQEPLGNMREKKETLFDWLVSLGILLEISNDGYFPYEPVVCFSTHIAKDEWLSEEFIKIISQRSRLSQRIKEKIIGFPVDFTIQEIVMLINSLKQYYG